MQREEDTLRGNKQLRVSFLTLLFWEEEKVAHCGGERVSWSKVWEGISALSDERSDLPPSV